MGKYKKIITTMGIVVAIIILFYIVFLYFVLRWKNNKVTPLGGSITYGDVSLYNNHPSNKVLNDENIIVSSTKVESRSVTTKPEGVLLPDQMYRSSYGFQIQIPKNWRIVSELNSKYFDSSSPIFSRVSFGEGSNSDGYDGDFGVFVYNKSLISVDGLIKDMGKQFNDRQEKRENTVINGVPAVKAVVTTPSTLNWVYEAVIVEHNNYIYFISNGAAENIKFNDFFNSFILVQ